MSSEASQEYFHIARDIKLVKVSNWSSWSTTIHGTLRGHHLLGHINGTTSPLILPSDVDAATRKKYDVAKKHDQKEMIILLPILFRQLILLFVLV